MSEPSTTRRVGTYEVISLIGAGGMGEVYRARDKKLGRDVALKILPPEVAGDRERMSRFAREAQVLALLNHPGIATIYGFEDGAIVMELVEGPTLADRLATGPLPLPEALGIARQMAEALEYAHERGIMHRDLKPANVKVTPEGAVKLLDFGLAKAAEPAPTPGDPQASPTLSMGATQAGMLMGTAAYMAPEQARGVALDKRVDIWAFGVVVYEMLTGARLFDGPTVSDSLASVLKAPIDWSSLPPDTPAGVRRLLCRCLERDRRDRLRDIGDARLEIREAEQQAPEPVRADSRRHAMFAWVVASVAALVAVLASTGWWRVTRPVKQPVVSVSADLGPNANLTSGSSGWGANAILSPDGSRLVYVVRHGAASTQLATRRLDRLEETVLADTDGAFDPFFSPDGQWVGFFAGQKLKKISIAGGKAVDVMPTGGVPFGASWSADNTIVVAPHATGGIVRVPAAGGEPQAVTKPDEKDGENCHRWPQMLPDGDSILYSAGFSVSMQDTGKIVVQSLRNGRRKVLARGGYYGRYVPGGVLLYAHRGTLFALRFDPTTWDVAATPVPIASDLVDTPLAGGAQFAVSTSGTLLYTPGRSSNLTNTLAWLDRGGRLGRLPPAAAYYTSPRISPDGAKIAVSVGTAGSQYLSVYDWRRDMLTRLPATSDVEVSPVWSTDSSHIVFAAAGGIYAVRADGSRSPTHLTQSTNPQFPFSLSQDGKRLAFVQSSPGTGLDIWTLSLERDNSGDLKPGKAEPFLQTSSTEWAPAFSPDGRWIAYTSSESGSFEINVRPFPSGDRRWQVSNRGGGAPVWSAIKPELYYRSSENALMAVSYSAAGDTFIPETPRSVSGDIRLARVPVWSNFDVTPDGSRFVVLTPNAGQENAGPQTHVNIFLNYFDELRRRVAPGSN